MMRLGEDRMPDKSKDLGSTKLDDWRKLAEKASNEHDRRKLLELVKQLCEALDRESAARKGQILKP